MTFPFTVLYAVALCQVFLQYCYIIQEKDVQLIIDSISELNETFECDETRAN